MTNILVTGGAGYIGSHTCCELSSRGYVPVTYDNLSNGHAEFVKWGPLEIGDIRDQGRLNAVFEKYKFAAIVHFAGLIEVGESIRSPETFYDINVVGSVTLFNTALAHGVNKLVFSSTCATYGLPVSLPINEEHPQVPINPYGRSKLVVEQVLSDLDCYRGFRSVVLRYFNAAGAHATGLIGERHSPETHAIPLAIETALGRRNHFEVLGTDYETRDGTCVRDFIHVSDLAEAHTRGLQRLLDDGSSLTVNLGTGHGTTITELLDMVERVSNSKLSVRHGPRRAGDSPVLIADNSLARTALGWAPHQDLKTIVQSAWRWHSGIS